MWLIPALASAAFLGVYDVFKKISLRENNVILVLFTATSTGAMLFLPLIVLSHTHILTSSDLLFVPTCPAGYHLYFMLKAVIVQSSWVLAYYAIKHLPLTVASPVRATSPVWTLIGALLIFNEILTFWQWIGVGVTFVCYFLFTLAGKKDGQTTGLSKWLVFMIFATLIAAVSSLYDKYLIGRFDRMAVQAWFSIYMVPVLLPLVLANRRMKLSINRFVWRWSIPMIAILLSLADFAYFYALSAPGAMISIVSIVRRSSVIISFTLGAILFRENNILLRAFILLGIASGILLIWLSS